MMLKKLFLQPKKLVSTLLRSAIQGNQDGLSSFGIFVQRFAKHVAFHAKNIERDYYFNHPPKNPAIGWKIPIKDKIVYDFGANRGGNIPYYLSLGMRVIAVEANPMLAKKLFDSYEHNSSVAVVNACLVPIESESKVPFFIHRTNDVLSTFDISRNEVDNFEQIIVDAVTPAQLFSRFGAPFFVKIDLEGLDGPIVEATLKAAPDLPFISAEAHSVEPFCHFVSAGYRLFKIVEAPFVASRFYSLPHRNGHPSFTFSFHDAGPFGEDIPGEWLGVDEVFDYIIQHRIGWKDIHARRADRSE